MMVCSDRYPGFKTWYDWMARLSEAPTEQAIGFWCGGGRAAAELMAEDVWPILTMKIGGPGQSAISHAMLEGGSALVRISRAWFAFLRHSCERVVDREVQLNDLIHNPTRAKKWTNLGAEFRNWENNVAEYEILTDMPMRGRRRHRPCFALYPLTCVSLP